MPKVYPNSLGHDKIYCFTSQELLMSPRNPMNETQDGSKWVNECICLERCTYMRSQSDKVEIWILGRDRLLVSCGPCIWSKSMCRQCWDKCGNLALHSYTRPAEGRLWSEILSVNSSSPQLLHASWPLQKCCWGRPWLWWGQVAVVVDEGRGGVLLGCNEGRSSGDKDGDIGKALLERCWLSHTWQPVDETWMYLAALWRPWGGEGLSARG